MYEQRVYEQQRVNEQRGVYEQRLWIKTGSHAVMQNMGEDKFVCIRCISKSPFLVLYLFVFVQSLE